MASILSLLTRGLMINQHADWLIFVERLNESVRSGKARNISVMKPVWSPYEEWYLDSETGEVYVYYPPDSPSLPAWEKIDVLDHLDAPDPAPLSVFETGRITVMTAHIMKIKIESLVSKGLVDELAPPLKADPLPKGDTEKWFRDKVSNIVYRLREHYGMNDPDDIRWEAVPLPQSGTI